MGPRVGALHPWPCESMLLSAPLDPVHQQHAAQLGASSWKVPVSDAGHGGTHSGEGLGQDPGPEAFRVDRLAVAEPQLEGSPAPNYVNGLQHLRPSVFPTESDLLQKQRW